MFAIHCPAEDVQVLASESQIVSLANTHNGIVMQVKCSCGAIAEVHTGRVHAGRRTPGHALAA